MRIGGIASGIDTESMIKQLMQVERQPLDRFFQRKQTIEWQRDAYRDLNLKLKALEESAFSIRLTSAFNTREAKTTSSAFTVSANSSVQNGTYKLRVDQIATKTRNISTQKVNLDPTISLDSQGVTNNGVFTIATLKDDGSLNEKEILVDTSKSLNQVLKQINDSNVGVRAYYDSAYQRVVFERNDSGEFEGSHVLDGDGNVYKNEIIFGGSNLQFITDVLNIDPTKEVNGLNARVQFENPIFGAAPIEEISKSNRVTIGGITFNLTDTTNGFETITVSSNTDQAFTNIKTFVDKYNETIAEIQVKLSEPRHRGFPPLNDEQRQAMSEREAELWDEKAMSGLLRNDSILSSVLNQMRLDLYTPVQTTGKYNQLSQIGISTTSNFRDGGKLEIDETKLRRALEDDPDSIHQLFNSIADKNLTDKKIADRTAVERQQINNQTGLIGRIRASISNTMDSITDRAGSQTRSNQQSTLGRELLDVDKRIDSFQRRLADIENRYWSQFTRMEKALNQANAQSASLMQFMTGLAQ